MDRYGDQEPRRTLIVGGAGFIGAHLARRLVVERHEVHVLLRPLSDAGRLASLGDQATVHRLDTTDRVALRECFARARPQVVFHLAGRTANRDMHALEDARLATVDTAALLAVIEAAAEAARPPTTFVRTGTIAEYGTAPTPFDEHQRERPANGYALTAASGAHLAQVLAPHLPFPLVTARLALVYGAGQASDFLVPSLIEACLARRPLTLRRPRDRRDLLHVDDVVDALLALARSPIAGGTIVNVGSSEAVSVAEIARMVLEITGAKHTLLDERPQDDPVTLLLSTGRMAALTGWTRRVALRDGLAALIAETRAGAPLQRATAA